MALRWSRIAILIGLGTVLGLSWNAVSGRGIALGKNVFIRAEDEVIEAKEAKGRLDKGALFLDARPIDFYKMEHVPGALPLPEDDFDKAFAKLEPLLRARFDLVVYCSGFGCEASHLVAARLRDKGIHVAILHEGWPAWQDAHYPTRTGEAP